MEIETDDARWTMEAMIASWPSDDDPRKHVYLVQWKGYSHNENTWKTYENVLECSSDLLKYYYGKNLGVESDGQYGKKKW